MDSAIEYYQLGKIRTVAATDAKSLYTHSIGVAAKQFVCPECGEYVGFVLPTNRTPHFKHARQNEVTKECERRVSSQNYNNSIYERLGLPLYLRKFSEEQYELCIGFYGLDESLITDVEMDNLKVTIKSYDASRSEVGTNYLINHTNFKSESSNLMKVDFISSRYIVHYSPSSKVVKIKEKWGDFIEGIPDGGALFTFNEYGGRKIRINDEITTQTEYLYLCRNELLTQNYSSIEISNSGSIILRRDEKIESYKIYKICFKPQNDRQFLKLIEFCREHFKVSLLLSSASLIPVWPPTVQSDNQINCIRSYNNFFLLKNFDKEFTAVYSHYENNHNRITGKFVGEDTKLIEIHIPTIELALTIRGKNSSIYAVLRKKEMNIKCYKNSILIQDLNGNRLESAQLSNLPYRNAINIYSDSRSSILHFHNEKVTKYKIKSAKQHVIEDLTYGDKIVEVSAGQFYGLLKFIEEESIINQVNNGDDIFNRLIRLKGPFVKPPYFVKSIISQIEESSQLKMLLKSYLSLNKIPIEGLKILRSIQKNEGGKYK
ncbi:hypothetical protein [Paenibacillus gallinarum]|uniref:Competence protein CoiA-like family protein n=1 Tax=Paenibacillus gallinarum TaxID=2762232 RepID=A0ABR8T2L6_9BACL|nr:hypothetical protein [Paenibacillus gallinarum]MBD7970008.1 hypothetical protein [Paenibacillus gallinarum]